MAIDRAIDAIFASRPDVGKILIADRLPLGKIHDRRASCVHAYQLIQGKLDGGPEACRRQDGTVVDPGLGDAQPRPVLERELEEIGLGPWIVDQLRVETEGNDPRTIDFDGLAVSPGS